MAAGDTIRFNGEHEYGVAKVARYSNFNALVTSEDPHRMYPTDPDNLLTVLREIYPPEREALGVLAIHLRPRDESVAPEASENGESNQISHDAS
jgi:ASC-1-like (ASCH) protein